jgi:hypothetical protein
MGGDKAAMGKVTRGRKAEEVSLQTQERKR